MNRPNKGRAPGWLRPPKKRGRCAAKAAASLGDNLATTTPPTQISADCPMLHRANRASLAGSILEAALPVNAFRLLTTPPFRGAVRRRGDDVGEAVLRGCHKRLRELSRAMCRLIAPFVLASNSGESSACSSGLSARRCSGDNRLQVGLLGTSRFEVAGGRLVQAGICAVKLRVPTAARNAQRRTLTPTVQAFCSTAHIGD